MLLDGEEVPAGEYTWMRLKVLADPDVAGDSYITIDGAECELQIPSGDERGLQMIRGFTIGAGTTTDFTVDFNLRQLGVEAPGPDNRGPGVRRPGIRVETRPSRRGQPRGGHDHGRCRRNS